MPPTPTKFHYTFNLRDISKVFQGIFIARIPIISPCERIARLWVHETARVFHDRLISDQDRKRFNNL